MKKVLLTGASGFVGKNLTQRLLDEGYVVSIVGRESSKYPESTQSKCNIVIYGQDDVETFKQKISDSDPDVVIHVATHFLSKHKTSEIKDLIDSNILFGTHLLDAISGLNVQRFINTSTYATSVSGKGYDPQNLYTATKKAFEDILYYYALALNLPVLNLSLYDTYGPEDTRPKLINLLLDASLKGEILNMSPGEQEICYTYVDDVVDAFHLGLKMDLKETWNNYSVHATEVFKLKDLAKEVEKATGKECNTNLGFYDYRNREIMSFNPEYPLMPGFKSKISIVDGITSIIKEIK